MIPKKEIKITEIGHYLEIKTDYSCGDKRYPIDNIIKFLEKAKKDEATHIEFSGYADSDSVFEEVNIQPVSIIEETDEELTIRMQKEADRQKEKVLAEERIERTLLQILKEKYE